jgi:hypothetical protein
MKETGGESCDDLIRATRKPMRTSIEILWTFVVLKIKEIILKKKM